MKNFRAVPPDTFLIGGHATGENGKKEKKNEQTNLNHSLSLGLSYTRGQIKTAPVFLFTSELNHAKTYRSVPNFEIIPEAIRVLELEGQSILDCARRLSQGPSAEAFKKAVECMNQALERGGKIVVTGVGKSGKIGQKISATLLSTGSLSIYLHSAEGFHGDLGMVRGEDVVLALSYTGNTDEVIRLIPSLKKLNVPIIGLGGNGHSKLARECTIWIDGEVTHEACPHNLAPTSSTTVALALGDAIAMTLMQLRGFPAQSFAANHPGGSLGKKLTLKVSDLMHSGDQVAVLDAHATMEQVVITSTEKKLGAVLIVDKLQLLGIITDGDLRRALRKREKFFDLIASEVMTPHPVTVGLETMAYEALEIMENRASQISVLPVVDAEGHWRGVIRLHDLIQSF